MRAYDSQGTKKKPEKHNQHLQAQLGLRGLCDVSSTTKQYYATDITGGIKYIQPGSANRVNRAEETLGEPYQRDEHSPWHNASYLSTHVTLSKEQQVIEELAAATDIMSKELHSLLLVLLLILILGNLGILCSLGTSLLDGHLLEREVLGEPPKQALHTACSWLCSALRVTTRVHLALARAALLGLAAVPSAIRVVGIAIANAYGTCRAHMRGQCHIFWMLVHIMCIIDSLEARYLAWASKGKQTTNTDR